MRKGVSFILRRENVSWNNILIIKKERELLVNDKKINLLILKII